MIDIKWIFNKHNSLSNKLISNEDINYEEIQQYLNIIVKNSKKLQYVEDRQEVRVILRYWANYLNNLLGEWPDVEIDSKERRPDVLKTKSINTFINIDENPVEMAGNLRSLDEYSLKCIIQLYIEMAEEKDADYSFYMKKIIELYTISDTILRQKICKSLLLLCISWRIEFNNYSYLYTVLELIQKFRIVESYQVIFEWVVRGDLKNKTPKKRFEIKWFDLHHFSLEILFKFSTEEIKSLKQICLRDIDDPHYFLSCYKYLIFNCNNFNNTLIKFFPRLVNFCNKGYYSIYDALKFIYESELSQQLFKDSIDEIINELNEDEQILFIKIVAECIAKKEIGISELLVYYCYLSDNLDYMDGLISCYKSYEMFLDCISTQFFKKITDQKLNRKLNTVEKEKIIDIASLEKIESSYNFCSQ